MTKVFYDFEFVIIYIHDIIIFTKKTYEQHVKRLAQVCQHIRQQNIHFHVEETYLASQELTILAIPSHPKVLNFNAKIC
jgi:hypothetical protein